jgi:hypothetical protein
MYKGLKVICATPAGRRRYMKALVPYIMTEPLVDEYHLWVNTLDPKDIAFLEKLAEAYPKIKLIRLPEGMQPDGNHTVGKFFEQCVDPDAVYVRFDDDVVFVEDDFMEGFLQYRLAHPEYFLTLPLTINNAISTCLLSQFRRIKSPVYIKADSYDTFGWRNPEFARLMHETLLNTMEKGMLSHLKIPNREMGIGRISINCISFLGRDFARFGGVIDYTDDEEWLTVIKPIQEGRLLGLYGEKLVAHFAYFTQREYMDTTNVLERYCAVAAQRRPEAYKRVAAIIDEIEKA